MNRILLAAAALLCLIPPITARAATILVDSNLQVPSFLFDADGDGSMDATEISNNDSYKNGDCADDTPDGLPDGNNDCKCQLSEAIVAANTNLRVDTCAPDASGDPLFGTFETIVLDADGPYDYKVIDNVGDNSLFNLGNGPNALPKVTSNIVLDGQANTLRRIASLTHGECKTIDTSDDFCSSFCGSDDDDPCEFFFRLFETDSFLFARDLTAEGFNPNCLAPDCQTSVCLTQCFSGGFMYVGGGLVDLDNVVAIGNQTNIDLPKNQSGGAVFIEGDACPEDLVDVSIHESILAENSSLMGGGISSGNGVLLTIDESTIRNNRAVEIPEECVEEVEICNCDGTCDEDEEPSTCGDCAEVAADETGQGGGIAALNNQLTIYESAVHDNVADTIGGGLMVFNIGVDGGRKDDCRLGDPPPGRATVVNTTVGRNTAFLGAGIVYVSFGSPETMPTFDVLNSTIAGNAADQLGGGVLKVASSAPMTFRNTIVADNTAFDGADGHGLFISEGHNHIGDSSGFIMSPISGDLFDQLAGLDVWTDDGTAGNGHFPLLPASLNIDSADGTGCPSIDQIQTNRDEDLDFLMEFGECSKGAIEYTDVCGDGRLEPNNGEECDDGNLADGDGCSASCLTEVPTEPEGAVCGNGTVEGGEACDDGESLNSDTEPNACRENCTNPVCGDGVIDDGFGEECDGEIGCLVGCSFEAIAGCDITMIDATTLSYKELLDKYGFGSILQCSQIGGGGIPGPDGLINSGINAGCSLILDPR